MSKNRFGYTIYDPLLVFDKKSKALDLVYKNMEALSSFLEQNNNFRFSKIMDLCKKTFEASKDPTKLIEARQKIELALRDEILSNHSPGRLSEAFNNRASKIAGQIASNIKQRITLKKIQMADIGCGDGLVAWHLSQNADLAFKKLLIADVLDYRSRKVMGKPFSWNLLPATGYRNVDQDNENNLYDLILVGTVLHHTDNPESVINACYRSLKQNGLLVIIESCIGIDLKMCQTHKSITGMNTNEVSNGVDDYVRMELEEQMIYGIFIDWFYNRVLHKNINTPYNFNTPDNWNRVIGGFAGMQTEAVFFEGFDQITVPEFHTIHFYRKNERK